MMEREMTNMQPFDEALFVAAVKAIAANGIGVVGKDGRARLTLEWIEAHGRLANMLRGTLGGEIPRHAEECAARRSPVSLCDCPVKDFKAPA